MTNKKRPQSERAEKGLLSCIFLSPERVLNLCQEEGVTEKWFLHPSHSTVFESVLKMRDSQRPIDLVTVTQALDDWGILEEVGGASLITDLFSFTPTASNAPEYLAILKEKYAQRLAMEECERVHGEVSSTENLQEIFNLTTGAFTAVQELCVTVDREDYDKKAMDAFVDRMEDIAMKKTVPDAFITGFPTFDYETGGLRRGEVFQIRGRSGAGKSLRCQAVIQHTLLDEFEGQKKRKVMLFTFEMPHEQYVQRMVASHGNISLQSMREGKYVERELARFSESVSKIRSSGLRIFDIARIKQATPEKVFGAIRWMARNEGVDMVAIDHMNLIKFPKGKGKQDSRTDELLHDFSAEFKRMALELNFVGLLLAQDNVDGSTFGSTQVETDVDYALSLCPVFKTVNGIKRIVGTDSEFYSKSRTGNLLGRKVKLELAGKFAKLFEVDND